MRDRPAIVAPPPLFAVACIAAGFVAEHFKPLPFFPGPSTIRFAISAVLFVGAVSVVILARGELVKHKEHPNPYRPTNAIVSSGIYGVSRNPIYIAFMLVVLGIAIAANSAWLLLADVALFLLLQFHVVKAEERYLSTKFGAEYDEYRQRTRRWF